MYNLECKFDSRQSFYDKAKVETKSSCNKITHNLYSYGTLVASVIINMKNGVKKTYKCLGKYSQTTTRHQKEFFKQLDLCNREIEELFKNGVLEKEY